MKKMMLFIIPAVFSLLLAGCKDQQVNNNPIWLTDYPSALQQAENENKYILMDFSGSDWCGLCIKLEENVFSQPDYIEYASKNLISVLVDFPRGEQTEEQKKMNKALASKYKVEEFPTVIILNSKGELVARTGYVQGDSAKYIEHIQSIIDNDQS